MLPAKYSFRFISRKRKTEIQHTKNTQGSTVADNSINAIKQDSIGQDHSDDNKRAFLKMAGIAGVGLVASQMIPKKAEALILGSTPSSNTVGVRNSSNVKIDPATEGTLATRASEATLATRASEATLATRASEATLATLGTEATLSLIKTNSDKFNFDGQNLKVINQGSTNLSGNVGLLDKSNTQIAPATDDSILYLRRIVKLMESQATVDSGNRQRITIDSLGAGTAITTTIPVSGSLTTAGTVSTVSTVTSVTNMVTLAGQNQQMFQDVARNAYANGIRQNLIFS